MPRMLVEVRHEGLAALSERMGRADMIRFLRQFDAGQGNYANERHEWVDDISLDEIKMQNATDA